MGWAPGGQPWVGSPGVARVTQMLRDPGQSGCGFSLHRGVSREEMLLGFPP